MENRETFKNRKNRESRKKVCGGGGAGVGWSRPVLGFMVQGQAEQNKV